MAKRIGLVVSGLALIVAVTWFATRDSSESFRMLERSEIDDPGQLDDLHLELDGIEPTGWVRRHRPNQTSPGFNLVLYRRRVPMIIDMNGAIVHAWPHVRAIGRARLFADGHLAVIGTDNLVKEYDWDGNLTWFFQLPRPGDFPHHDFHKLANGNYLILASDITTHADYLWEVNEAKQVVWEWWAANHVEEFPSWDRQSPDPTHANSIQVLPPNGWSAAGDLRFRPGNILVSARNLNTIFVIDRETGEVVWTYTDGLDRQHEARMVGRERLGSGLILLFNNGLDDLTAYRRSRVQAIDPVAGAVVWEYASKDFFSSVAGTAQVLPGKTILVSSSQGGRVFEITPAGSVVWEWAPPYKPMRVERLAFDHCPQLARIEPTPGVAVRAEAGSPYIDQDLYRFEFLPKTEPREIDGREKNILPYLDACRELLLPVGPSLTVEFGLDRARLGLGRQMARFHLEIRTPGRPADVLFDVAVASSDRKLWRRRVFDLSQYELQRIELCLATDLSGEDWADVPAVAWANPAIRSRRERDAGKARRRRLTDQERRVREQNLKALGYVE